MEASPPVPASTRSAPEADVAELVCGVLSAQAISNEMKRLGLRVQAFDEKLLNLTRLVQLSQSLQDDKEAALRAENAELRARLERQEAATELLRRELTTLQATLAATIQQAAESHVSTVMRDYSGQVENRLVSERNRATQKLTLLQDSMQALAQEVRQVVQRVPAMEQQLSRLDAAQTRVHETCGSEVESTRQWTRRNMQRLKQHLDAIRSELAATQGQYADLSTRLEQTDCKAETEYRKLRLLFDRKVHEADALSTLMEKELRQVSHLARQHGTLRTECATQPQFTVHRT